MDTQKDVGVIVSNDMSWNPEIDIADLKANKTFFAIKRNYLNRVAKLNFFKFMIISMILCASPC